MARKRHAITLYIYFLVVTLLYFYNAKQLMKYVQSNDDSTTYSYLLEDLSTDATVQDQAKLIFQKQIHN